MEMELLHHEIKKRVLDSSKRINRTGKVERKSWKLPVGNWDVSVLRGSIVEKATTTQIILNTKHPVTGGQTRFNVFQVMVYPAKPGIPILLINIENRVGEEDIFAGFLDVAPVAANSADLKMLQRRIQRITLDHGQNYDVLRAKLKNLYYMETWDKPVNAEIGIRLEMECNQYGLLRDGALGWIET